MRAIISPSRLKGTLQAAASKSSMQRACAAALVAPAGKTLIRNPGHSNDDKAALDIIQRLGATVIQAPGGLEIHTRGVRPVTDTIDCGESGLSIRMFTPLAALSAKALNITGSGSLVDRPMDFFDEIFPYLDVKIQSRDGRLPLQIQGPLQPRNITIDGSLSSQFLTGLLLAYSAAGAEDVSIKVNDLKSRPYIDLTLEVMRQFGLRVPENVQYQSFYYGKDIAQPSPASRTYTVEGDWSGAAFLLVAGAIAGPLQVTGLDIKSPQADKAILQALVQCGAGIKMEDGGIRLQPVPLKAYQFDATDCPDLFPPLVALAAYCEGISVIEGTSRLTHKESNRALTLQEEFGKMGIRIELEGNFMRVHGAGKCRSSHVHSRHDHRIAMACAVAALRATGDVVIEEAQAINKSYPDFYTHLQEAGAEVELDA
jgi:3-phosphoshikimate 1-carboxyvinyltransferase